MLLWEENLCFSGQIRDFPPTIIIVFFFFPLLHLNPGLVERVRGRDCRPCSSSNPSSRLQQPNHAAFWSSVQTDRGTHTLAAAAEIRRTARRTQLKRSPLIEVFSRSAKVLRGFSPYSGRGQLLGPAAAALSFEVRASQGLGVTRLTRSKFRPSE